MLSQTQLQKQNMKILPQQIQMLGIYHLNMMDLEQRIKDELDENPLLEKTSDEEVEAAKTDLNDPPQEFQNWDEYGYDDIPNYCLLYTSDAADERSSVDLGGRRIIK